MSSLAVEVMASFACAAEGISSVAAEDMSSVATEEVTFYNAWDRQSTDQPGSRIPVSAEYLPRQHGSILLDMKPD